MTTDPEPDEPRDPEATEEYRFSLLDGYWEALRRGEAVDPEHWARPHPEDRERLGDLRLIATLHDALCMVREDSQAGSPSAAMPAGLADNLPAVVGGYRRLRWLGGGGMGEVYEAEDCSSGQRVALKLISPHFEASADSIERFRREGRLASMIAHPRCVFVLAADEEAGQPYIVMELMPGSTLKDLVEQHGPLPPEEAVRKVLDVIDGLREAHRLQVLHRDVKPSNCFLEADGRVKVGDFGLSRSLAGDAALTQAGTFLGTIHYASPEQFKGPAAIDFRSDVYAVAATLYFLLTGQPPFPDANPATVVARKASEPAPPVRSVRPDVPPALDRVVLRGLERDRERRWRDLTSFRRALLPFVPGHLSVGGLGMRVGALLIDVALLALVETILVTTLLPAGTAFLLNCLLNVSGSAAYFALAEGVWGCSLGKRLVRLRVGADRGSDRPGPGRVLLRTLLFHAAWLPWVMVNTTEAPELEFGTFLALWWASLAFGTLVTVSTMRARNGYRGLHELLSGTRVVQLPWPGQRPSFAGPHPDRLAQFFTRPDKLPERVGPFVIRGALPTTGPEQVLLGEDSTLKRLVWVRLGLAAESPADAVRREVRRPTRLRWLAGGRDADQRWDAFLAPFGRPLADSLPDQRPLPWRDVRPLLEQLADELAAAAQDGTMPPTLTVDQVWVQPDGRVQLLDTALGGSGATAATPGGGARSDEALALLRQVAVLALEGQPRPPGEAPASVQAPLPLHASRLLERLLGVAQPFENVEQVRAGLAATQHLPVEVTPDRRAAQLGLLGAFLFVGLYLSFMGSWFYSFFLMDALTGDILQTDVLLRVLQDEALRKDFLSRPDLRRLVNPVVEGQLPRRQKNHLRQWRARRPFMKYGWGLLLGSDVDAAAVERILMGKPVGEVRRVPGDRFAVAVTRDAPGGEAIVYDEDDLTVPVILGPFWFIDLLKVWPVRVGTVEVSSVRLGPVLVSAFSLIWVLWAFLFRGGFSLRLMGLVLVRSNGRPALRIQCAWRALLVWAPLTALLLLSAWLDYRSWGGLGGEPAWGAARLALASWWLAVGLLAAYFILAFRRPGRGLHDRLARTYLVPR